MWWKEMNDNTALTACVVSVCACIAISVGSCNYRNAVESKAAIENGYNQKRGNGPGDYYWEKPD